MIRLQKLSMIRMLLLSAALSLGASGAAQQAQIAPVHAAHSPIQVMPSADEVWNSLMAGNRRFVAGKPQARDLALLRHKLASGQSPKAIILSCSDSRVGPELIAGDQIVRCAIE